MKKLTERIPESLIRVLVVFAVFIGVVVLVRSLIPASMKNSAEHRALTVDRESSRPVRHAGSDVCGQCHEEYGLKKEGYHRTLSCETCHYAAADHADNPGDVKPRILRQREFCSGCHTYNVSRPTGFPQINPAVHNPLKSCITCHNPHSPKPPEDPKECSACHAQIARTKAISPHVQLACTDCHEAPKDHKLNPRAHPVEIPSARSFCGKCHATGSKEVGPPKIDMDTHGEKYLCWQCHYPHMPEVD